jgi:hypothetical protein
MKHFKDTDFHSSETPEYTRTAMFAEASELNMPPGIWPMYIKIWTGHDSQRHGDVLTRCSLDESGARYLSPKFNVTIFND